jgi:hypothetical protein
MLVWAVCSQSCRKGCTDSTAFNYQHGAKVNDGSCLYCDSAMTVGASSSFFVEDQNSASQFPFEDVLGITLTSNIKTYNGNGCKLLGYSNSNPCIPVTFTAVLQNQTSVNMTFSGTIEVFTNTNQFLFSVSNVNISQGSSVTLTFAPTGCQTQVFNISGEVIGATFSYH